MHVYSFQVLTTEFWTLSQLDYEYFLTWKLVLSFEVKIEQLISEWIKMNSNTSFYGFDFLWDTCRPLYKGLCKRSAVFLRCLGARVPFKWTEETKCCHCTKRKRRCSCSLLLLILYIIYSYILIHIFVFYKYMFILCILHIYNLHTYTYMHALNRK